MGLMKVRAQILAETDIHASVMEHLYLFLWDDVHYSHSFP